MYREKQTPEKPTTSTTQTLPTTLPIPLPSPSSFVSHPRIAFIIDDFGNDFATAKPFLDFPYPIAISVLPLLHYSKTVARYAEHSSKVVLLHLPVEAVAHNELLGPGAVLTSMDVNLQEQTIENDLKSVPQALGVNNHLGSKGTTDLQTTQTIAFEAKTHHLFVVDSLTNPDSILYDETKKMGVPAGRRDVFLDNSRNPSFIQIQIAELASLARKNGKAIAIGHPYPETLKALQDSIPKLLEEGIDVVPINKLISNTP